MNIELKSVMCFKISQIITKFLSANPGRAAKYLSIVGMLFLFHLPGLVFANDFVTSSLSRTGAVNKSNESTRISSDGFLAGLTDTYYFNNSTSVSVDRSQEQHARSLASLSPYKPDYDGLKRDTKYFFGFQFLIVGILYVSPESVSGWSEEQKRDFTIEKYKHNVQTIIWDNDKFYINYILHPYWGMAYYLRARERGYNHTDSFWYSVALSTLWEFGLEAMFEEVSIQDVFITPIVGSVIGKYVDEYRQNLRKKPALSAWDDWMMTLTDPLGSTNRWVDDLFGKNASVSFSYSILNPNQVKSWEQGGDDFDREVTFQRIAKPSFGFTFNYKLQ